jgi:hypothetical protein
MAARMVAISSHQESVHIADREGKSSIKESAGFTSHAFRCRQQAGTQHHLEIGGLKTEAKLEQGSLRETLECFAGRGEGH